MMEGNNDIFLAGDDALGRLTGPMHKKYSMTIICGHQVRVDLMTNFLILPASPPAGIYLLKVNNRNTRTRCEICSKVTIKTPERRH